MSKQNSCDWNGNVAKTKEKRQIEKSNNSDPDIAGNIADN